MEMLVNNVTYFSYVIVSLHKTTQNRLLRGFIFYLQFFCIKDIILNTN